MVMDWYITTWITVGVNIVVGGLLDVLLPALHHGAPVLAYKFPNRFDPKKVQEMCRIHKVKHVFLPPTALKMMKQVFYWPYKFCLSDNNNLDRGIVTYAT